MKLDEYIEQKRKDAGLPEAKKTQVLLELEPAFLFCLKEEGESHDRRIV
ncbi:hypothetical protein [Aneurinibacillus aneurinilyticus]|jgi:hypothetical protein|uniref:Uncharacterized protein n=1 Tax=Aneurinibacillus aneurinilyticus ATCC 12856 TaxID=649747 RepID=U1WPB0_ANEAE|nr:hypothetical protein [Aneurinibacillus aneurinilyticus]ERI10434.1 hypothetical protein HMPREF0083_01470 [Aneurinibacillus aneurinilyticus ATCC 12856]MED0709022.1 hypothetical protein [Aneurinibacillus aneurinilyticus]MED0725416.1 hypothetical protein [Aneurinibacillus aneurinilyticus]MED0730727.1 hypothetical protein [Aneurinibacillus aneurinilyticus]MED0740929.1 hypothetical protein [Aneurinibacillus aneurinilyticus]